MRAAAAAQFTLPRRGAWVGAAVVIVATAAATLSMWLLHRPDWPGGAMSAVAVSVIFAALALLWLRRLRAPTPALSLRWDAQRWHLGPAETIGHEPSTGELSVEIDLGAWMLLRFRPEAASRIGGPVWLPVQRRGFEAQWHTLRCAVYSPRPHDNADAAPDV